MERHKVIKQMKNNSSQGLQNSKIRKATPFLNSRIAHERKNASLADSDVGAAVKQSAFELDEFNAVIKWLTCNRSPGPDELTTELVKWLNSDNRQNLLVHFNDVLLPGNYPESLNLITSRLYTVNWLNRLGFASLWLAGNLSSIASMFTKRDPAKLENYRPIALLQTVHKMLAALVKNRLDPALEPWMSKTPYDPTWPQKEKI